MTMTFPAMRVEVRDRAGDAVNASFLVPIGVPIPTAGDLLSLGPKDAIRVYRVVARGVHLRQMTPAEVLDNNTAHITLIVEDAS